MTDNEPKISYTTLVKAIDRTQDRIEVNNIRYKDIQNRLAREDTNMNRRAELISKETMLNAERQELDKNLRILVDAHNKIVQEGSHPDVQL